MDDNSRSSATAVADESGPSTDGALERSHFWLKTLLALSIFVIGGELVSRAYWSFTRGAGFFSGDLLWHGFSLEGDEQKHADYGSGGSMFALWGKPKYVTEAIDQHNDAIRELAKQNAGNYFVDQRARLPRSGQTFHDCCHLTPDGCRQFVESVLEAVAPTR